MKRREFIKTSAMAAPLAVTTAIATPAIAQGKIEWKLPTSFPAKAPGVGTNVTSFAARVNAISDGRLTLKVFSGGELVPPFGVEDAVHSLVDAFRDGRVADPVTNDLYHNIKRMRALVAQ